MINSTQKDKNFDFDIIVDPNIKIEEFKSIILYKIKRPFFLEFAYPNKSKLSKIIKASKDKILKMTENEESESSDSDTEEKKKIENPVDIIKVYTNMDVFGLDIIDG